MIKHAFPWKKKLLAPLSALLVTAVVFLAPLGGSPASAAAAQPALSQSGGVADKADKHAAPELVKTQKSNGAVTLVWSGTPNAEGYKVHYGTKSGIYNRHLNVGAVTRYKVEGLTNDETYYFAVSAVKGGKLSNELSETPVAVNGPVDNPVETKYPGEYAWTNDIKWENVKNILDFGGVNEGTGDNTAAFNAARDAAEADGGGVVYFPAGTYTFGGDLYLTDGVVIRGEAPDAGADAAVSDSFALKTRFEFPAYVPSLEGQGIPIDTAFKKIKTLNPQTDSNIGVVDIDINRAGIVLKGDGLTNTNHNILVYGVRTNNVADASLPTSYQNPWQRWSYRFTENIGIQADSNVLVANTRNNDNVTDNYEQPGYILKNNVVLQEGYKAEFSYTNHYGISVNRSKAGGYTLAGTPETEPSLFRPGIVIRDNYVFHTMRVAITAAGTGLQIKSNVIRDQKGKMAWVDPTGTKLVGNSTTLENRAIDWSGYHVVIDGNDYQVYRHRFESGYASIDGEGILIQECCGGTLVKGLQITNNTGNAYIGVYKTRDISDVLISGNMLDYREDGWDPAYIMVSANTNGAAYTANNVVISNNTLPGGISLTASGGTGSGNAITGNTNMTGSGTITYSAQSNASVSGNTGFTVVEQ